MGFSLFGEQPVLWGPLWAKLVFALPQLGLRLVGALGRASAPDCRQPPATPAVWAARAACLPPAAVAPSSPLAPPPPHPAPNRLSAPLGVASAAAGVMECGPAALPGPDPQPV
jgi:hypothetical protein